MLRILSEENSIFSELLSELRDIEIQKDRARFRLTIEKCGELLAYELSKTMKFRKRDVQTPLGLAPSNILAEQPVLATVLRAGLPLHQGVLNIFRYADNAFISAFRNHHEDGSFEIVVEYIASPKLQDRILILVDPMLATGQSIISSYESLLSRGVPKEIHIVNIIGSKAGIAHVQKNLPDAHIWIGAVDNDLNDHGYIVPGLGDSGDLSYGEKL